MVSNHFGRRSLAFYHYEKHDVLTLMKITRRKTELQFLEYFEVTP